MEDLEEKERQDWIDYRNAVYDNKSKSQDDFEKYINLLASGGIVLSLTFLEEKRNYSWWFGRPKCIWYYARCEH